MTQKVHFVGICGTAMGAVATAMAKRGFTVTGSDENVYPPMSTALEQAGIPISVGYSADNLPDDADFIVIGNAMSRGNAEVEAVLNKRLLYLSLPETLKTHFLRGHRNFVVSGTHGKTTTTSMLTWLLEYAGKNPGFMIGGIPRNMGCGGRITDSEFFVLEGDEYDTAFFDKRSKFLHYLPEVAIMNNIEFDHADIFHNIDEIKLSFSRLLRVVPGNGLAIINGDDANCCDVIADSHCPIESVGINSGVVNPEAQKIIRKHHQITDIQAGETETSFCLDGKRFAIHMSGEFNVRNASMAIIAARQAGLDDETIAAGLIRFEGVARRQEERGRVNDIVVIDDFAHHPTAIEKSIGAIRTRYEGYRVWGVFEPRSNTSCSDVFQNDLPKALAQADFPVVAKAKTPKKGQKQLDEPKLKQDIAQEGRDAYVGGSADEIAKYLVEHAQSHDVILVMSNGGFDNIHNKILQGLEGKYSQD
jgi:UDP-N-acetylmuramate: L-alanyl-gamma-D-glutamyl-meso-diaminopimelate ligase